MEVLVPSRWQILFEPMMSEFLWHRHHVAALGHSEYIFVQASWNPLLILWIDYGFDSNFSRWLIKFAPLIGQIASTFGIKSLIVLMCIYFRWFDGVMREPCLNRTPCMMTYRSSNGNISASLAIVRGIHRSPVNFPHKGQWRGALRFSLICAWIKRWVNNRETVE